MHEVNQLINTILQSNQPSKTRELINLVKLERLTEVNQCIQLAQVALEISALAKTVEFSAKALSLEPENQALYTNLITTHMFRRDSQNALRVCNEYIAKFGDNPVVQSLAGNAYSAIGEFIKSEKAYKKALKVEKNLLPAIQGMVKCKKFDEKEAIELIQTYQTTMEINPHPQAKSLIKYCIAKLYNDIGYYEAAWNQASQANELVDEFNQESRTQFSNKVENIISNYSNNAESSDSEAENLMIVGMPRSGTTLLETIISNSKEYYPGGEAPSLNYALTMATNKPDIVGRLTKEQLNDAASYYNSYYQEFSQSPKSRRIINKLPFNFMKLGLFRQLFPQGKIIFIKRDYRDVIASSIMENFSAGENYTTSIENIIYMYRESEKIMDFWKENLESIFEINYQDLITKKEECYNDIADFLGIDASTLINHQPEKSNIETPSLWQVRQPLFTSSLGRFKNYEALKELPEQLPIN